MLGAMATMTPFEADVRLAVYRHFLDHGAAPTPDDLAAEFAVAPMEIDAVLRHLQQIHDAVVMIPGGRYLWMAEPFSALPTSYRAVAVDGRTWYGNCAWDALAVLSVAGTDGTVMSTCPATGRAIGVEVRTGTVTPTDGVAHFAVTASEWWRSIGFT